MFIYANNKIIFPSGEYLFISPQNSKMGDIPSISTSSLECSFCQDMQAKKDNVCSKCYARKILKLYKNARETAKNNYDLLTSRKLTKEECKAIAKGVANHKYVRFEAFGEIEKGLKGLTQIENYYNIAKESKKYNVTFILWTKNIKILNLFFANNPMLKNLKIILSSYQVNKPLNRDTLPDYLKECKIFTVVNNDSPLMAKRNCYGGTNGVTCSTCQLCYASRIKDIIEALRG